MKILNPESIAGLQLNTFLNKIPRITNLTE